MNLRRAVLTRDRGAVAGSAGPDAGRAKPGRRWSGSRWSGRRWSRRSVLVFVLVGLAVIAGGWTVLFAPMTRVDQVQVSGVSVLSADEVRKASGIAAGTQMIKLDVGAAANGVRQLTTVESVSVSRQWPSTVMLTVVERTPALAVEEPGRVALYDRAGVLYRTVGTVPSGVPKLTSQDPEPKVVTAVLAVVADLPASLLARLAGIRALTPDSVELDLTDGVVVVWGSAEDGARKADVLTTLMKQPGQVYVVAAPEVPAIRP